jgi:hypothetical protein
VVNYENAVKPFLETNRLSKSDWAMLMGGACANVPMDAKEKLGPVTRAQREHLGIDRDNLRLRINVACPRF